MQAHPLSSTAARISSLSHSLLTPRSATKLPPTLLLPAPTAAPHQGRTFGPGASAAHPLAEHAGLAHDAGNLLGALNLYADLLSMPGVLAAEHRHFATDLHLIAARSSALIRRLMANSVAATAPASQPDATPAEVGVAVPTTPAAALRSLAPVLQRIAAGAATVTVAVPASLPGIDLPAEALERITVNLVRNAAEAIRSSRDTTEVPGRIRVALESTARDLRLVVEDDGPGMPPAVAAELLNPTPLPAAATRGLGHRIVHELATSTGATLSLRVRPGRGTVFCLRWPLPQAADDTTPAIPPLHHGTHASIVHRGVLSC